MTPSSLLASVHRHLTEAGLRCALYKSWVIGGEGYEEGNPGCFTGFTFTVEPLHPFVRPLVGDPGPPQQQLRARVLGLGQFDSGTDIVGTDPRVVASAVVDGGLATSRLL